MADKAIDRAESGTPGTGNYFFTSESVGEGHPDKACDRVSDAILDACLTFDPFARVAVETALKHAPEGTGAQLIKYVDGVPVKHQSLAGGILVLNGEVTVNGEVDFVSIALDTLRRIGYVDEASGMDTGNLQILLAIRPQSSDISQGVTAGEGLHEEQGAGDQGMMFGYACSETPELMPASHLWACRLTTRLTEVRRQGLIPGIHADAKSQVTVEYRDGKLARIDAVVISVHHYESVTLDDLRPAIIKHVIKPALEPTGLLHDDVTIHVNPTGRFVIGGPNGDAGLTGRKIIVDTYGGHGAHGGGAFSGKDPSKVDRSAAYLTRYIAKHIVAAGLAERCLVQVAYAIGVADPLSVFVETYGTEVDGVTVEELVGAIRDLFPLKPADILEQLNLRRPIYSPTAAGGHFGRSSSDGLFPWEQIDSATAQALRRRFGLRNREGAPTSWPGSDRPTTNGVSGDATP